MSIIGDKILSRLEPMEDRPERRLTVQISASKVEQIKQIAKAMSGISGRRVTQMMLFEDAVDAFIEACMDDPKLGKYLTAPEQERDSMQWPAGNPAGLALEQEDGEFDGPAMTL